MREDVMSNYQILEIALEAAFFATVAAISVIFAVLREKSIRKKLANEMSETIPAFRDVMQKTSDRNTDITLSRGDRVRQNVTYIRSPEISTVANELEQSTGLSGAERELIASITD